jgi:hypothetical protein
MIFPIPLDEMRERIEGRMAEKQHTADSLGERRPGATALYLADVAMLQGMLEVLPTVHRFLELWAEYCNDRYDG